jgi:CHASE3 domain sensor protein
VGINAHQNSKEEEDEEEFLQNLGEDANDGARQALSNIERIVEEMVGVIKRQAEKGSVETAAYTQIMFILTYLKIICTQ